MDHTAQHPSESSVARMRALTTPLWIIAALLVLPVAASVWFGVVSADPLGIDAWWHDAVVAAPGSAAFTVASVLHVVGSTKSMAIIAAVLVVLLVLIQRWREAATIAVTMLGVLAVVVGLKFLVDRPRPVDMLVEQGETSFPSGHSLAAAALLTSITCIFAVHSTQRRTVLAPLCITIVLVPLMMWSRTALHVHWLSDTVCGALIGIAIALVVGRALLRVPEEQVLAPGASPRLIA